MQFTPQQNVVYKISTALDTDFVLDVSQAEKTKDHMLIYKWQNAPNQKFAFRPVGGGKYAIFCAKNNMTVEVPEGSTKNGEQIVCSQPNKKENEFWQFIPVSDKRFAGKNAQYIKSYCGKALDVCEGKAKNDQKVIQWDHNDGKNQIWIIEPTF